MASIFVKTVTLVFFAQAFLFLVKVLRFLRKKLKESLTAYFQATHSESHLPHPISLFPIMSIDKDKS